MWIVAIEAGFGWSVCMGFDLRQIFFFMTLIAEGASTLDEQALFGRLVRIVTGYAVTVGRRIVLERRLTERLLEIFVALETELVARFREQLFCLGLVWVMTGNAFAVFNGLMFHRCG